MATTARTTRLEAVNSMLSSIGEAPVNNLSSGLTEAETAETILNTIARDVQSAGWNFNTEYNYAVAVNSDGEVLLPDNVVRADLARATTKHRSTDNNYVQRGNRIYDTQAHTYNIGKDLLLDVIVLLDFEELPEVVSRYVTLRAARIFQEHVIGSENLSAFAMRDETAALVVLRETEGDNGDYNIFDDYSTASVLDRNIGSKVTRDGFSF